MKGLTSQSCLPMSFLLYATMFQLCGKVTAFSRKTCRMRFFFLNYCNSHSNAETMWMVFPSTTTSRVCVKAISVRRLQESASDALTSDEVSRSYAR